MKFQKTLLALSLGVMSLGTVHAAQEAKPVSVTENLLNNTAQDELGNPVYQNGWVVAPVHGQHAQTSLLNDRDVNYLPGITGLANGTQSINLGTGAVSSGTAGAPVEYDVFKYQTIDGTTVYQFENTATRVREGGTYVKDNNGNLALYTGSSAIDPNTLESGGKVQGQAGFTTITGFQNRQLNGEHVIYGYQGGKVNAAGNVDGYITAPGQINEYVSGQFGATQITDVTDIRYVQTGILANTGTGPALDPSKNIYGVSARNNNNVVMMSGDGIALADLSLEGTLFTDGSVVNNVLVDSEFDGTQKTRQYNLTDGRSIIEYYNNDAGRELPSVFYELKVDSNGSPRLVRLADNFTPPAVSDRTGTGEYAKGKYDISKVHNTVTNKNVTYSEKVESSELEIASYAVTDANGNRIDVDGVTQLGTAKLKSEQSVSTGVIGKNADNSNQYGLEVKKVTADAAGVLTTAKTTVTSAGVKTTGFVDAADFRVAGVSITQSLNDAVEEAQQAAGAVLGQAKTYTDVEVGKVKTETTAAIAESKQYTDTKTNAAVAEVKTIATNVTNSLNNVNNRIDDVQKTAYRGVAIALAAQQQVPNIKPGQFAVFGGVGHYESESAAALGVVGALNDRLSMSAALGFAGGSEVGGRVGVAYVFGGN